MLLYFIHPFAQYFELGLSVYPLGKSTELWTIKKNWYLKVNHHPWIEYRAFDFAKKYASTNNVLEFTNLAFEAG